MERARTNARAFVGRGDRSGRTRDLNRTFHNWHVLVEGLRGGQLYGWRVHGPWAPEEGHRFDPKKVLVDPYARGVVYAGN